MRPLHSESHLVERIGWLRAAVLGANDGIISTASLILGVAAARLLKAIFCLRVLRVSWLAPVSLQSMQGGAPGLTSSGEMSTHRRLSKSLMLEIDVPEARAIEALRGPPFACQGL